MNAVKKYMPEIMAILFIWATAPLTVQMTQNKIVSLAIIPITGLLYLIMKRDQVKEERNDA